MGNALLALSCYPVLYAARHDYRFDGEGEGAKQVPGPLGQGGSGSIGPGSLTATDMWSGRARDGGADRHAETRPAKATTSAKMRMAAFILSNPEI